VVSPAARRVRCVAAALAAALAACAPRASVQPAAQEGMVAFFYDGAADGVVLRATFTGWQPVPLARVGGRFQITVAVPLGRHEYRLEVRRGEAVVVVLPEDAERVADGFGGENAIIRVP
jgi:outer membrane biogenesis lipoprotein LolB